MNIFKCERCGFTSKYRSNFIRHLKRKFTCDSKLSNININIIKEQYGLIKNITKKTENIEKIKTETIKKETTTETEKIQNQIEQIQNLIEQNKIKKEVKKCKFCNRDFTTRQALSKHMKYNCKVKNIDYWKKCYKQSEEEKNTLEKEKLTLEKEKIKLMKQIEILLTKVGNNNITTINNNTQNNNIIIKNFGEENISYLTDYFFTNLLTNSNTVSSIPTIVKEIHCNKQHPENMNIKILNKKTPFINVYKEDKWQQQDKKKTIQKIVNKNFKILDSKYNADNIKNSLSKNNKNEYDHFKKELINNKQFVNNIVKNTEKVLEV